MRKLIFIAALLSLTHCSKPSGTARLPASDEENKLFDDFFKEYTEAINRGDYNKVLGYVPYQSFEKVSKEKMIEYLIGTQKEIGILNITDYKIIGYGDIFIRNDSAYRKVRYESTIATENNPSKLNPNAVPYLRKIYGDSAVEYDSIRKGFVLHQVKDLILIRKNGTQWVFLEYDPKKENKLLNRIVPIDILAQLTVTP